MKYLPSEAKKPSIYIILSLLLVPILCIIPHTASGQMFSVDGPERDYSTPTAAVFIGLEPVDFEFTGNTAISQAFLFEFSGPVLRFKFEAPNLSLSLGTGGAITGLDDAAYFDGALKANFGLTLISKKTFALELPIQLTSSLTSVTNDDIIGGQLEFRQVNIAPGAGARIAAKPADRFRIQLQAIPSYGFSSATGGTFGGSVFIFEGQARLYFDRLFDDIGLSVGYDYNFKDFNIDDSLFDYELNSHGFLIGISF